MACPKVSIIVPMYCAEKYLNTCIDSLIGQTLSDIEIILVDDGSPDSCGKIADEYATKDPRIKVIHQKNSGQGGARNAGIQIATGMYIAFVDSDDWVKPVMYQSLYEVAISKQADIVVSGHCDVAEGKILATKQHPLAGVCLNSVGEIKKLRKKLYGIAVSDKTVDAFPMSACMSLYSRKLVSDNGISFVDGLSEDVFFNLTTYYYAQTIAFISDVNYCYRKEEQPSLTHSFTEAKLAAYRDFLTRLKKWASSENDEECKLRAQRTAIDSCRMYIGIVGSAAIPLQNKIVHVQAFVRDPEISACWEGYPLGKLPMQQRLFYRMVEHECYVGALFLAWFRQCLKKGKQKIHGIT